MSAEYEGQDPLEIAQRAERDLNSHSAKHGHNADLSSSHGHGASDSTAESGVDESVTSKFPGSTVQVGSAASGAGDNREIPIEEGGDLSASGRPTKARDFEGPGGPETKQELYEQENPGNDDVSGNVRQGTETRRP
ncbi:hypothetical protein MMC24_005000 [Lignoscripta atroalba]|nr:hypothetical protein [Lignoscripta atroalba]